MRWTLCVPAVALLGGCASALLAPAQRLTPGQDEAAVRAALGPPTGRYALADGGSRLEYARGPMGFETWMVDLGRDGRVAAVEQVLNRRRFAQLRVGMPSDELLRLLGRPSAIQRHIQGRVSWFWRHTPYDCLWFGVTLSPQGQTLDAGGDLPDPRCDVRD